MRSKSAHGKRRVSAKMTGKQRVVAAFKGELADCIPAYPISGQFNAQLVGATIKQFLTEPKVFVKAQLASYERFQPDIMLMMADLLAEVEALGNELKFPDEGMCISKTFVLADKGNLARLSVPDPYKDARMPNYLEACREARKQIRDCPVSAVVAGPWSIAIGLRGAQELLRDSMKDGQYVHELMELTTEVSITSGEAVREQGVGVSYSEAPASCSLISPKTYRQFVFPYHKKIVDHFRDKGVRVGLHVCGYTDPILEDMVATGVSNISIDAPSDLGKAMQVARGKAVVIGNVNTNLFFLPKREELQQAIRGCLETTGWSTGYILSTGCEVPAIAPPEHVEWFMDAARRLGKL
jgi:uroporphyrinogen decarboxylase